MGLRARIVLSAFVLAISSPCWAVAISDCVIDLTTARQALVETANVPLATYFAETVPVAVDDSSTVQVSVYNPENLEIFLRDLMSVLAAKAKVLGFPSKKFDRWLLEQHHGEIPMPDSFTMKNIWIREGATLGVFAEGLVQQFVRETIESSGSSNLFSQKSRRPLRKLAAGLTAATFMTVVLQLQGPISGFVNVPLTPINDYTSRLGTRYLSWSASGINSMVNWLDGLTLASSATKGDADSLRNQLIQTADSLGKYNFEGLTRDQSKEIWDAFETKWFDFAQNSGKLLNSYEAFGRDNYLMARLGIPEAYALNIVTVKTNIEVTKAAQERLMARAATNVGSDMTAEQSNQMKDLEKTLKLDKHLLAMLMADWMLNHLFHPETWNAAQLKNSGETTFRSIDEYLGLPEFVEALKSEIVEVFEIIDVKLKAAGRAIPDSSSASKPRRSVSKD